MALENTSDPSEKLEIISHLGFEYWTIDAWKAIEYGRKGLQMSTQLEKEKWIAFNFRVIGVAYWVLGDYFVFKNSSHNSIFIPSNWDKPICSK